MIFWNDFCYYQYVILIILNNMKKSILFGVLAFFAVTAMGIQNANAQEVKVKKAEKATTVSVEKQKPSTTTADQAPVKQKKDDCCDSKTVTADQKKTADCCDSKATTADQKKVGSSDQKKVKTDVKAKKADGKKVKKAEDKSSKRVTTSSAQGTK